MIEPDEQDPKKVRRELTQRSFKWVLFYAPPLFFCAFVAVKILFKIDASGMLEAFYATMATLTGSYGGFYMHGANKDGAE